MTTRRPGRPRGRGGLSGREILLAALVERLREKYGRDTNTGLALRCGANDKLVMKAKLRESSKPGEGIHQRRAIYRIKYPGGLVWGYLSIIDVAHDILLKTHGIEIKHNTIRKAYEKLMNYRKNILKDKVKR